MDMKEKAGDPLKTVHRIHHQVNNARCIAEAMDVLGMRAAEDLHHILDTISTLVIETANGICQETHDHYQRTMDQTGRIMGALLDASMRDKPV